MHLSGRGDGIRDRITHSNSNSSSRRERMQQLARQRYGQEARARALMELHGAHGAHVAERAVVHLVEVALLPLPEPGTGRRGC